MSTGRLHHVGLTVFDLERSVWFYRELLGLSVRERDEAKGGQLETVTGVMGAHVRIADLEFGGGQTLELTQYLVPQGEAIHPLPSDAGHTHIGIEVADIEQVHKRLVEAGITLRSQPVSLEDSGPFWTGARVLHALDPDGVTVELVQMPSGRAT